MDQIRIFVINAKADDKYKEDLLKHLFSVKEDENALFLDRKAIEEKSKKEKDVRKVLAQADIVILLISAEFFNSDWCKRLERQTFLLEKLEHFLVVPVMLSPVALGARYDSRTTVPDWTRAVTGKYWNSTDEAFHDVALKIRTIIDSRLDGTFPAVLTPPSFLKRTIRKLQRPIVLVSYFIFLVGALSFLLSPKKNLPAKIKLTVSQVEFRLIEVVGSGLWMHKAFAKQAILKNFDHTTIPGKSIRLLSDQQQSFDLTQGNVAIKPLLNAVGPNLYLFNVQLSELRIADSTVVMVTKNAGSFVSLSIIDGKSTGQLSFNDSLQFYTESCQMKLNDSIYTNDLEAIIYSSQGRIILESENYFSVALDFEGRVEETNIYVSDLDFTTDSQNEKGTPLSTIMNGEITIGEIKTILLDSPETYFLELLSGDPLKIQKIDATGDKIEISIISDSISKVNLGLSLAKLKNKMPTILEWLTNEYKPGLLVGIFAFLSPLILLGGNILKKISV